MEGSWHCREISDQNPNTSSSVELGELLVPPLAISLRVGRDPGQGPSESSDSPARAPECPLGDAGRACRGGVPRGGGSGSAAPAGEAGASLLVSHLRPVCACPWEGLKAGRGAVRRALLSAVGNTRATQRSDLWNYIDHSCSSSRGCRLIKASRRAPHGLGARLS